MSFSITHRYGAMKRNPPLSVFPQLLAELDGRPDDREHGSVSVKHESEWCLSAGRDGYVIFENVEGGKPRHMRGVSKTKIIELWLHLAAGELAKIEAEPWLPGY